MSRLIVTLFALLGFVLILPHASRAQNTISTIAGGGTPGGSAHSAFIAFPQGVAQDSHGNTYVAAYYGDYIFKVTRTGSLTVYGGVGYAAFSGDGGPAISAGLNSPATLALDGAGNLFIADDANNRIRKINATTGKITTVAGSGPANMFFQGAYGGDGGPATQARLNSPFGVAVDSAGNIYIADTNNERVRRVDGVTHIITTVAGNGTAGFSGDNGPATAAKLKTPLNVAVDSAGNLFITDSANNRIRRVDASTQIITTVAGGGNSGLGDGGLATLATLSFPNATTIDHSGNLFIADTGESRVRRVDATTQIITTLAGNGTMGYRGDGGLATAAELSCPAAVFAETSGSLLIGDAGNQRVRVVNASGIISTMAGGGTGGDGGPATSALLSAPDSVALDNSGNTVIVQEGDNRVRLVSALNGAITPIAGTGTEGFRGDGGPATQAWFFAPTGVGVDSSGNLYIADLGNERVRRISAGSGIINTIAGNGTFCTLAPCGDGGPATSASLALPSSVAIDGAGNIFIVQGPNSVVRRVDAITGIITTIAGNYNKCLSSTSACGDGGPATSANLNSPLGIALDSSGNLFIADTGDNRIRRVDAITQIIKTVAFTGAATFGGDGGPALSATMVGPIGVAVDATGNLFIGGGVEFQGGGGDVVVRRVNATTQIITTVAGNHNSPTTFGFSGDGGLASRATLDNVGLAVDSAGDLYIADGGNNRIRKVLLAQ